MRKRISIPLFFRFLGLRHLWDLVMFLYFNTYRLFDLECLNHKSRSKRYISSVVAIFLFLDAVILSFLFINLSLIERLILGNTIFQAFCSALCSSIAGTFVALIVYKYGRPSISNPLLSVVTGFYFLPAVVVTFEIMELLEIFSLQNGLGKIIFAHTIMNISLASLLILQQLRTVLSIHFEVAANLRLNSFHIYRYVLGKPLERGFLKSFFLVFVFCFVSFMPVILFSSSPLHSTLEVAIYQYFQTTFDITIAVKLILVQITFLFLFFFIYHQPTGFFILGKGEERRKELPLPLVCVVLGGGCLVVISLPFLNAIFHMIAHFFQILQQAWECLVILQHTLLLAVPVGILTVVFSLTLLFWKEQTEADYEKLSKYITLLVSIPTVSLTVLFYLVLRPQTLLACLGLIILIQTFIALPLIFKFIAAKFSYIAHSQLETAQSLGMGRLARLRILYLPQLKNELGIGFIVGFLISIGDFVCVSLLAPAAFKTLSVEIFHSITGYQFERTELLTSLILLMYICLFFPLMRGMQKNVSYIDGSNNAL